MKVRCMKAVPYALKIDSEYIVYGITLNEGSLWYFICDHWSSEPTGRPSRLFEIIDNRLSRYWVFSQDKVEDTIYSRWVFPEWAEETYFIDRVFEGERREYALFDTYRELMDLEFPDPDISEKAQIGDSEWLICPTCMDAWLSPSGLDALVICPKCHHKMQNPRYPWDKEPKEGKVTTFLPTNDTN